VIAILDYGSGNLRSAQRAFETSGKEVILTSDYEVALNADGLVVPGVGAFAACMQGLAGVRGDQLVRERIALKRPTLGICVGMQILFSRGVEYGNHDGVGVGMQLLKNLMRQSFRIWDGIPSKLAAEVHSSKVLKKNPSTLCIPMQ
jgi:glutamine amidotransferase